MKKFILFIILFALPASASGLSNGTGLTMSNISCTTIATASAASPQTAICSAGYYITGGICLDATAATVAQPTTVGGIGGSITCTAAATNVTATAYCCH